MRLAGWTPIVAVVLAACERAASVDPTHATTLILRGGTIHTMDEAGTVAEAMVIRAGAIVHVGDDQTARAHADRGAAILELGDRVVLPGFHDVHTHLIAGGTERLDVDLAAVESVDALVEAVATWAEQHPDAAWVRGGGWDMASFAGSLHASQLDVAVLADRPVFLISVDGHSALVNAVALARAGIDASTPDPPRGRIERDDEGVPTGILHEAAIDLVADRIPPHADAQVDRGLAEALREAKGFGITTIVDASVREWMLAGYARAEAAGTLTLRVHAAAWFEPGEPGELERVVELRRRYSSERVEVDAVKFFVDGILESGTAHLLEPYLDGDLPAPYYTDEVLERAAIELDALGFQLHAHVIGDGAARQFLDVVEAVARANGPRDRRPQLAHLELVHPDDLARFAALGAYANFQMLWAWPDPYVRELTRPVIGEPRSTRLYPIGALHAAGATIVAGSDWSVSSMNPFEAIEVAITRQDPHADAGERLGPDQRIDLDTALRAYTSAAAEVTFSEALVGSLEVGKRADFVIVDRDPFAIAPAELSEVQVEQTWLEGERVFERPGPQRR
ncbi:amidohydrolase [Nannocystaceae bacterium ST9]